MREKKRKEKTPCGGYIAMGKSGCTKIGQARSFPQIPECGMSLAMWLELQVTQPKDHAPPTLATSCHCSNVLSLPLTLPWGQSQESLHLERKTVAKAMCLLLPASSPKERELPFWADKMFLQSEQPGMQRGWSWQSGTWVQSLGNTTMGK